MGGSVYLCKSCFSYHCHSIRRRKKTVDDIQQERLVATCSVEISLLPSLRLPSHPKAQNILYKLPIFLSPHLTEMVSKVRFDGTIKIITKMIRQ